MAAVIEGIGGQTGLAETLGDMVVSAGVLTVAVREGDHPAHRGVGSPDVVDDPDPAHAFEGPLGAGCMHTARVATAGAAQPMPKSPRRPGAERLRWRGLQWRTVVSRRPVIPT